jgi:hypothetical protein
LRRAATLLRKIGIEISFEREGRARTRSITTGQSSAPNRRAATIRIVPKVRRSAEANSGQWLCTGGFAPAGPRTGSDAAEKFEECQ